MEYLTLDLLKQMDDDDPKVAEKAEKEWYLKDKIWYERFQICKNRLPKRLLYILENCYFFHDSYIQEVSFKRNIHRNHTTFDVILTMQYDGYDEPLDGWLIHRDVRQFNSQIQGLERYVAFGDYLYGEMFLNEEKLWVHNFLCFKDSEVNIVSKKIEWVDRKK